MPEQQTSRMANRVGAYTMSAFANGRSRSDVTAGDQRPASTAMAYHAQQWTTAQPVPQQPQQVQQQPPHMVSFAFLTNDKPLSATSLLCRAYALSTKTDFGFKLYIKEMRKDGDRVKQLSSFLCESCVCRTIISFLLPSLHPYSIILTQRIDMMIISAATSAAMDERTTASAMGITPRTSCQRYSLNSNSARSFSSSKRDDDVGALQ